MKHPETNGGKNSGYAYGKSVGASFRGTRLAENLICEKPRLGWHCNTYLRPGK
jgi:hypothetical protein